MRLNLPSDQTVQSLGPRIFSSESELQRFMEDHILPTLGLRLVSSSGRLGQRLGDLDTVAVDDNGTPAIVEYKWDLVDARTIEQLAGYKRWLLDVANRPAVATAVAAKFVSLVLNWRHVHLVAVGHRYHPSASLPPSRETSVLFLRYGYRPDRTVFILSVPAEGRSMTVGEQPPIPNKDHRLPDHLARTTEAGRRAFHLLRGYLRYDLKLEEKIHGKNRVTYGRAPCTFDLTFTSIGLQCFFDAPEGVYDPEGRSRSHVGKRGLRRTVGIVSPADVEYVASLLKSL